MEPIIAALNEMMTCGQLGAFLLKDENMALDLITNVNLTHLVADVRQSGCNGVEGGLTMVLYPL